MFEKVGNPDLLVIGEYSTDFETPISYLGLFPQRFFCRVNAQIFDPVTNQYHRISSFKVSVNESILNDHEKLEKLVEESLRRETQLPLCFHISDSSEPAWIKYIAQLKDKSKTYYLAA